MMTAFSSLHYQCSACSYLHRQEYYAYTIRLKKKGELRTKYTMSPSPKQSMGIFNILYKLGLGNSGGMRK